MASSYVDSKSVRLVSEAFIRPKFEIPDHNDHPYYLGVVDIAALSIHPMQKGLLFESQPNHNFPSFLDTLKRSLSLCLLHFYPLAGRFVTEKFPEEHTSWIYVDCSKGPGARVFHATVDLAVSDILSSTDVHPIVRSFFDLREMSINYDGHTMPLLSIQVTELLDGVFLGFTVNHTVADGSSVLHFLSTLSHIFTQLNIGYSEDAISISNKPIYKPFFPQGFGPILKLPYLEPEEFVSRFEPGLLRERIFHFSSEAVSKLKTLAQAHKEAQKVSSFSALCAHLWKHVTRARNLNPTEETHYSLIINARFRIEPPISEAQFGNVIGAAETSCKVEDILGRELGWIAMLAHRAVAAQDDKNIRGILDFFVKAPFVSQTGSESALYKTNSVLIAGSSKFDMYGPEFGLGRAVALLAGYANKDDGKVTANPGREGRGSVDLEVCLKPSVMDALELDDEFMSFVS